MAKWCIANDVRLRVPELRQNMQLVTDADIDLYIEIATQWAQAKLSIHYSLDLFVEPYPVVIKQLVAVHAALILLRATSVAANGESIIKALTTEEQGYLRQIQGSSLRYDDGSHIPSTAIYHETVDIPSQVEEAWPNGIRPGFNRAPCTC